MRRGRGERRAEIGGSTTGGEQLGWNGMEMGRRVYKPEISMETRLRRGNMHKEVLPKEVEEGEERPVADINDLD